MSSSVTNLNWTWQALNDVILGVRDFVKCSASVTWGGFDRFLNKEPPAEQPVQQNRNTNGARPRSVFDEQRLRLARENGRAVEPFLRPMRESLNMKWWKHAFYNVVLVLAVVCLFDYCIFPLMETVTHLILGEGADKLWAVVGPIIKMVFGACWVLPSFIVLKITNFFCFDDIASAASIQHASRIRRKRSNMTLAEFISDMVRSLISQTVFLIQTSLIGLLPIPYLNQVLVIVHITMLYSLYAFEYRFTEEGLTTHQRIRKIEKNWPYFIGFSLLFALSTTWLPHWLVSSGVFAAVFPLAIISAYSAKLTKHDEQSDIPELGIFKLTLIVTDKIQGQLSKALPAS